MNPKTIFWRFLEIFDFAQIDFLEGGARLDMTQAPTDPRLNFGGGAGIRAPVSLGVTYP